MTTAALLRSAIDGHGPSRGKRYDGALKTRIIAFAQSRREQGASLTQIAEQLGLGFETIRRWCQVPEPHAATAMRPVHVVPDDHGRTVSVTSAAGYRIEGLTLDEAIAVLRALG